MGTPRKRHRTVKQRQQAIKDAFVGYMAKEGDDGRLFRHAAGDAFCDMVGALEYINSRIGKAEADRIVQRLYNAQFGGRVVSIRSSIDQVGLTSPTTDSHAA